MLLPITSLSNCTFSTPYSIFDDVKLNFCQEFKLMFPPNTSIVEIYIHRIHVIFQFYKIIVLGSFVSNIKIGMSATTGR